ncbi:MAG TPA: GNAT family N-acetyltransferase [Firmicutes bacterium]|nr:GNAT family N-acetyltransferase [Bacillota bacterium]
MIRIMTIEDYERVYKLWSETKGMGLRSIDDSIEGIERFLKRNPRTSFVAEADGEIAGAIICGHDGRRGYIYHTAVKESLRGQGIGKQLANSAIAALKAEGITRCGLFVFAENERGKDFWLSLGWVTRPDLVYFNLPLHTDNK